MKTRILSVLGLVAVLAATPAHALTVEDVIGLTRAGASDAVIMAKIDADGTVFRLTVEEILELKSTGVSDAVITYMINSGKLEVEATAPEVSTPAQSEVQSDPYEGQVADDGGDFGMSVGVSNYGFGISFGYYYPHWPGYWYGGYYDPFYWTSWPYYYSYWQPYPYHWWYYDPWYACYPYPHHYYDGWYDYHYPGYGGHYRDDKGRNVGNRGPVDHADRVIKGPGSPGQDAARVERTRQTVRLRQPSPGVGKSDSAPTVIRGKVRSSDPSPGRTVHLKPVDRTRYRSQPAKLPVGQRRSDYRGSERKDSPKVGSKGGDNSSSGGSGGGEVKSRGSSRGDDKPSSGSRSGGKSFGSGGGRSNPSPGGARPSPSPSRGGSSGSRSGKGG